MAEELDYIPMPDTGRQADREDLVGRHQELRHASRPQAGALPQAKGQGVGVTGPALVSASEMAGPPPACTGATAAGGRWNSQRVRRTRRENVVSNTGDWRGRHGRSERRDGSRRTLRSRQGPQRFQARRRYLLLDHARLRDFGAADPRRHHPFADRRRLAGDEGIRLRLPVDAALGAVGRSAGARRARPDLRHADHLRHRDDDRDSRRSRHCDLPHRALPAMAAPSDRHRHRTARRHSLDHLRHVGLLRARPVPGQHLPALHDQAVRRRARCSARFSPARRPISACSTRR